jgi:hypothetical protein
MYYLAGTDALSATAMGIRVESVGRENATVIRGLNLFWMVHLSPSYTCHHDYHSSYNKLFNPHPMLQSCNLATFSPPSTSSLASEMNLTKLLLTTFTLVPLAVSMCPEHPLAIGWGHHEHFNKNNACTNKGCDYRVYAYNIHVISR